MAHCIYVTCFTGKGLDHQRCKLCLSNLRECLLQCSKPTALQPPIQHDRVGAIGGHHPGRHQHKCPHGDCNNHHMKYVIMERVPMPLLQIYVDINMVYAMWRQQPSSGMQHMGADEMRQGNQYHISGICNGEFNLVVWQIFLQSPN